MRLIIIRSIILLSLFSIVTPVSSATTSSSSTEIIPGGPKYKNIATLKIKDIQKIVGRKLTLKEKIGFTILKHKVKRQSKNNQKKGQTALIFGIVGLGLFLIGLFVPFVILGSLVAAIVAIVIGSSGAKEDSNSKARAGKLLGWITLALIGLLFIVAAIVLASWV